MASALILRILTLPFRSPTPATCRSSAATASVAAAVNVSGLSEDPSAKSAAGPHPETTSKALLAELWIDDEPGGYGEWKEMEARMLGDIQPTMRRTKEILHSNRYLDGAKLSKEDEKLVVEKLLAHHPRSEEKIGCGLHAIMVDTHPKFNNSRCLFVVRTDGGWIDFSYQKCLLAYLRKTYPTYAERFIKEHFRRSLK